MKFAGLIHPGILGCAPSAEVLETWNKREGDLIAANKLERLVAQPPNPTNVHAGAADAELKDKVGKEGARTSEYRPPSFLPVSVPEQQTRQLAFDYMFMT